MEQKRKLYSLSGGVIALTALAALTLMILSIYHKIGEGFFFVICSLILFFLFFIFAQQIYERMNKRQWAWFYMASVILPCFIIQPLIRSFVNDGTYSKWQEFCIPIIATMCLIFVI